METDESTSPTEADVWARKPGRPPGPETASKARRRTFTAEYKLRILEEVERAGAGKRGAILRREGLYSSHLTEWRKARHEGALSTLSKRRGRKPKSIDERDNRIAILEKQLAKAEEELRKANLIMEVQGKVSGLLGINLQNENNS